MSFVGGEVHFTNVAHEAVGVALIDGYVEVVFFFVLDEYFGQHAGVFIGEDEHYCESGGM